LIYRKDGQRRAHILSIGACETDGETSGDVDGAHEMVGACHRNVMADVRIRRAMHRR
jgi:hypothetical protein